MKLAPIHDTRPRAKEGAGLASGRSRLRRHTPRTNSIVGYRRKVRPLAIHVPEAPGLTALRDLHHHFYAGQIIVPMRLRMPLRSFNVKLQQSSLMATIWITTSHRRIPSADVTGPAERGGTADSECN